MFMNTFMLLKGFSVFKQYTYLVNYLSFTSLNTKHSVLKAKNKGMV